MQLFPNQINLMAQPIVVALVCSTLVFIHFAAHIYSIQVNCKFYVVKLVFGHFIKRHFIENNHWTQMGYFTYREAI